MPLLHPSSLSFRLLLLSFVISALLSLAPIPAFAAGPLDALSTVQRGIDSNSMEQVNKGMDIDAILDTAYSSLATLAKSSDAATRQEIPSAIREIVKDPNSVQSLLLKSLFVQEVKDTVGTGVRTGFFSGTYDPNTSPALPSVLRKMKVDRIVITPGKIISQNGNEAHVSATVSANKGTPAALELRLSKENSTWRVKEITNLNALVTKAISGAL